MNRTTGMLVGILVSLLGGLVAGATQTAATDENRAPIDVPIGSVGDAVSYVRFERPNDDATWRAVGFERFIVARAGTAVDAGGRSHETLLVEFTPRIHSAVSAHVDLGTREIVKRQLSGPGVTMSGADLSGVPKTEEWSGMREEADYGPFLEPAFREATDAMSFWFQGDKLTKDARLPYLTKDSFRNLWGIAVGELESFSLSMRGPLALGGEAAFEISMTGKAMFNEPKPPGYPATYDYRVPFLSTMVPSVGSISCSRHMWIGGSSAYPLLIEDRVVASDGVIHSLLNLDKVEGSASAIPWSNEHGRPAAPFVSELSPAEQTFPSQGNTESPCLQLSTALSKVQSDAEHESFRQWQNARAPVFLVGVQSRCDDELTTWNLAYANAIGDAFGVIVRTGGPPTTVGQRLLASSESLETGGLMQGAAFSTEDLPRGLVTLAQVESQWNRLFGGRALEIPGTEIQWGFTFPGNAPDAYLFLYPAMFAEPAQWERFRIYQSVMETDANGTAFSNFTVADIDADTGTIQKTARTGYYETTPDDVYLLDDSPPSANADPRRSTVSAATLAGATPRQVGTSIAVSGTLLAIWLTIYFLPLVKYALAQGVLLLPGYAKLRKDRLLDHRLRDQLVTIIRDDPGASATDIANKVEAGWSTVVYHLGVIEKNRLVTSLVDTRHRRFFPVGDVPHGERGRIAVLRNQRTSELYHVIQRQPGLNQGALAKHIGISLPGVAWHLKRLEQERYITRVKRGRSVEVFPQVVSPNGVTHATPIAETDIA